MSELLRPTPVDQQGTLDQELELAAVFPPPFIPTATRLISTLRQKSAGLLAALSVFAAVTTAYAETPVAFADTANPAVHKEIVIYTADKTERLWAYENGHVVMDTDVITGSGQDATPTGYFQIRIGEKIRDFIGVMPREWLGTNHRRFRDTFIRWALGFTDVNFIHDAPWQNQNQFGPGSRRLGGFGCVEVPDDKMKQLYDWAEEGTPVTIKDE